MAQAQQATSIEWLLEGFKYELAATAKPKTVDYYHGHARRFLLWAQGTDITDIRLITKRDIQAFFHHLMESNETAIGGNGSSRQIKRTDRTRWPYYRSLRRFFSWAMSDGFVDHNPMDGIVLRCPADAPVEPYRP